MPEGQGYRDLQVWQRSMDWIEAVYRATKSWPTDERFGLTSQTRRAAVSVAANIAEGAARHGRREFTRFLRIAKGSLAESETLLLLSRRLSYTPEGEFAPLLSEAAGIGRMLSGLIASLEADTAPS